MNNTFISNSEVENFELAVLDRFGVKVNGRGVLRKASKSLPLVDAQGVLTELCVAVHAVSLEAVLKGMAKSSSPAGYVAVALRNAVVESLSPFNNKVRRALAEGVDYSSMSVDEVAALPHIVKLAAQRDKKVQAFAVDVIEAHAHSKVSAPVMCGDEMLTAVADDMQQDIVSVATECGVPAEYVELVIEVVNTGGNIRAAAETLGMTDYHVRKALAEVASVPGLYDALTSV